MKMCKVCDAPAGWYYSTGLHQEPPDYGYRLWQGENGQWCKAHVGAEVEARRLAFAEWQVKQSYYMNRRMEV